MTYRRPTSRYLLENCPSAKLKSSATTSRIKPQKKQFERSISFCSSKSKSTLNPQQSKQPVKKLAARLVPASPVLKSKRTIPRVHIDLNSVAEEGGGIQATPKFYDLDRSVCGKNTATGSQHGLQPSRPVSILSTIRHLTEPPNPPLEQSTTLDMRLFDSEETRNREDFRGFTTDLSIFNDSGPPISPVNERSAEFMESPISFVEAGKIHQQSGMLQPYR